MNTQPSPLVPQGSLMDQKNQGRARVKIAVFVVLAVHGIGLMALLMAGCQKEPAGQTADPSSPTNTAPTFEPTNVYTPETNVYVPPPPATNDLTPPPVTNVVEQATAASEYTVAKGDSFYTIAKKLGVPQKALEAANPGVEPTKLQVGQKLKVPAPGTGTTPLVGGTATESAGPVVYTVKSNDTLTKIASQYHTSVKAIQSANNLTSTRITVGQKLKIPVKTGTNGSTGGVPAGSVTQ